MQFRQGFTLIEISISVFILLLLMLIAVPSLSGVMADRRLRRPLDDFNRLVQEAQSHSVTEHRPYLIVWGKDKIFVQPETRTEEDGKGPTDVYKCRAGDAFRLSLPAALEKTTPGEWVFWSSGTCEPAIVSFKGADGNWTARYSPLTARSELLKYGR